MDRTPSLTEFHRSVFLICTFAYIVHQLVLSCYAHVLHLFFIIVSQFQLQFPLMFLTSVGAFSSFSMPTPHPMHDDAHCWVTCIIGRERENNVSIGKDSSVLCILYWSLILQNKTDYRSTTELQNQGQESRTQDCRFDHGLFSHRDSITVIRWRTD